MMENANQIMKKMILNIVKLQIMIYALNALKAIIYQKIINALQLNTALSQKMEFALNVKIIII